MAPVINAFFILLFLTPLLRVSGEDKSNETAAHLRRRLLTTDDLDGTLALGASAGPFTLSAYSSSDIAGTTQIYELSPNPIPANTFVGCEITSCSSNGGGTTNIWMKAGSLFDSDKGDVGGPCGDCSSGSPVCVFDMTTSADCAGQPVYVMVYTDGSGGGNLENVVISCYDNADCRREGGNGVSSKHCENRISSKPWSIWEWLQERIP